MADNINPENKKEIKKISITYIIFFISIFTIFIPIGFVPVFATMISVLTLSAIYSMRSSSEEDSLTDIHMTFLIRTFWRMSLYLTISSILSIIYLVVFADYTPLSPCFNFIEKNTFSIFNWEIGYSLKIMELCYKPFFNSNYQHLVITTFIALSPILIYLVLRCIYGWFLLKGNKVIPCAKL